MSAEVMSGGGGAPKLQVKTVTPSTSSQNIAPDSGYDGLSKVTVNAIASGSLNSPTISGSGLVTANVGTSGYISSGTSKTLQLPTQSSKTVTPGRYSQTAVSSGLYTTGSVTVSGDSNLTSANIRSGVSIFGVYGSYEGATNRTFGVTGTTRLSSQVQSLTLSTYDSDLTSESQILFITVSPNLDDFMSLSGSVWCGGCIYNPSGDSFVFDDNNPTVFRSPNMSISVYNGNITINIGSMYFEGIRYSFSVVYTK